MLKRRFDPETTAEAIIYIATNIPKIHFYDLLKLIYLADKRHLAQFGFFFTNDTYSALREGPVPSSSYNMIKAAKGDDTRYIEYVKDAFDIINTYEVTPLRAPDMNELSESAIDCLNWAISQFKLLGGHQIYINLHEHDKAYIRSWKEKGNDVNSVKIPIEFIIDSLDNAEYLREYYSTITKD